MAQLNTKEAAKILGKQLTKLCLLMGMYKNEFAVKLGYTQAHIGYIMAGKSIPTIEIIYRLKRRYPNINIDWLLYDTGEPFLDKKIPNQITQYKKHQAANQRIEKRTELAMEVVKNGGTDFIKKHKITVPETVLKPTQKKK